MMLFSVGAPLTPAGGSSCSFLKSRMRRRLAGVDIVVKGEEEEDKEEVEERKEE